MIDYYQNQKLEQKRRRKNRITAFIFLFLFLIILGGIVYFLHSRYSKVESVSITFDTNDIDAENSMRSLLSDYLNNRSPLEKLIFGSNNIVFAMEKSNDIRDQILKSFPAIDNVKINVEAFDRRVVITANSRKKFGLWCDESGSSLNASSTSTSADIQGQNTRCFWFDDQGVAFVEGPDTEGQLIYKVIDNYSNSINLGDKVVAGDYVPALISMFKILDQIGSVSKTLYMRSPELEELSTDPSVSPTVYFSLRNNPSYATKALDDYGSQILKSSQIDLRIPNRIYYK